MYKCEFVTQYIFKRTQSMDYPGNGTCGANIIKQNAKETADAVMTEAEAFWKELEAKFRTDEIYKTDIRGITRERT